MIPVVLLTYSAPACPPPLARNATDGEKDAYGAWTACDPSFDRDDSAYNFTGQKAVRGRAFHNVFEDNMNPENLTVAEFVQPMDIDVVQARGWVPR